MKGSVPAAIEDAPPAKKSLHKVSDSSGKVEFTAVSKKITRDAFESGDVFLFDIGKELFVWVGNGTF